MNKEDYSKYYIQGSDHYLIPKYEFNELFDEMFSWREEAKELKKQLEENKDNYNCLLKQKEQFEYIMSKQVDYQGQKKEFINYLEDKIQQQETVIAENQEKLYFLMHEDEKEDLKLSSQKAYIRRITLEEILQKYKSIIGDNNGN